MSHHAYLKWPRLIAFNITGALAVVATGLSAQSLVNLNHDKAQLARTIPGAQLHVTNVVGATAAMTATAGLCALYCFALSVAILFKWHREETRTSILVKEIMMFAMAVLLLVAAIIATVIIVPKSAGVSAPGFPQALLIRLIQGTGKSIKYRDSLAFDAMIVVWICFASVLLSFILAALSARHIRKHGPTDTLLGHKVSDQHDSGNGHSNGTRPYQDKHHAEHS